jgi:nitroreductase
MTHTNGILTNLNNSNGIMSAIYKRHSVRDYSDEIVNDPSIHALLYAAIQAPTALHQEPWVFAIVQNKKIMHSISETAKNMLITQDNQNITKASRKIIDLAHNTDYNIFYNAGTLIVIYGKPLEQFVAADCWLATQNLILAAYGANLGSCIIGSAVSVLNTQEWKEKLSIPQTMTAYAPIIIGYRTKETLITSRKPPQVLCWLK